MNWGYKITIVIVVFILAICSMVYIASKQNNEMIDDNYYEKELAFQSLIDGANNLKAVSKQSIFSQDSEMVTITIPTGLYSNISEGSIEFLRNDNQKMDLCRPLKPDSKGIQQLNKSLFIQGVYNARIKWTNNDSLYYFEQKIFINL